LDSHAEIGSKVAQRQFGGTPDRSALIGVGEPMQQLGLRVGTHLVHGAQFIRTVGLIQRLLHQLI